MTTTQKPETTAVATTKPALPAEVQRSLEERKTRNLVAAKIAGMSWGAALDLEARRALADWGQQHAVDVTTEIHILGNRIYKNADFYINRAQPYVRTGMIAIDLRYINVDKRLDEDAANTDPYYTEQAAEARREIAERRSLRIQFNVPESAQSAVLCVVRFPRSSESFPAAKWCGGGSRAKVPIGDGNPEAAAATRAIRKALKMAVGYEPEIALTFGDAEDDTIGEVQEIIHRSQTEQKALNGEIIARERQGLRNIRNPPDLVEGYENGKTAPIDNTAHVDAYGEIEPAAQPQPNDAPDDDDSWIAAQDDAAEHRTTGRSR